MKLSLKFREETQTQTQHKNPLIRAKLPVTILNFPFQTAITTGDSSDLSFSLRTNFISGPSLSLSYHPTLSPPFSPFSLSLKSGISLFGSPHNSPLVFTATFNPNSLTPTFSLLIKPQFGSFSLFKEVDSGFRVGGLSGNGEIGNGSVSDFVVTGREDDGSGQRVNGFGWNDLKRDSSVFEGVFVSATTSLPVLKRAVVNFRWGVNFLPKSGIFEAKKPMFPILVMNKISLERVDEVKKVENKVEEAKTGDLELLKGMCSWMSREVEELQRENKEMKHILEDMKVKVPGFRVRGEEKERETVGKRRMVGLGSSESLPEFEKWRSKKGSGSGNGDESGNRESKSRMSEVGSELQKAIKAASS